MSQSFSPAMPKTVTPIGLAGFLACNYLVVALARARAGVGVGVR